MFGFFKKVPEWASYMDKKQYARFMASLKAFLKSDGSPAYKIDDGVIVFSGESPYGLERAGLQNLTQICTQARPEDYPGLVSAHFDKLKKTDEFFKNFDTELQDFERVEKYLGIRLQGREFISQVTGLVVAKEIAEGLYALLVFDLPDAIRNVHPDEANPWKRSEEELFEVAQANIRQNYPPEKEWSEHGETGFWMVWADHFFSPNIVLDLAKYEDLLGPQGAVIGLPHRHVVMIHPIKSLEVVTVIGIMATSCRRLYAAGPGSISPDLFWYKDGRFTRLPFVDNGDKLEFYSPEGFTDMLNNLTSKDE